MQYSQKQHSAAPFWADGMVVSPNGALKILPWLKS
jgi:hypothetical protein